MASSPASHTARLLPQPETATGRETDGAVYGRDMMGQRGILMIGVARVVSASASLAAVPIYTAYLSPADYGLYALVIGVVAVLNAGVFHWVSAAIARLYPVHIGAPGSLISAAKRLWLLGASFTGVCLLVTAFLATVQHAMLITSALAMLLSLSLYELCLEFARSRLWPGRYSAAVVLSALTSLGVGVFALKNGAGLEAPLVGAAVGQLTAAAVLLALGCMKVAGSASPRLRADLTKSIFVYGLPLAGALILAFGITAGERLLIDAQLGSQQLGIYAAAYGLVIPSITLLATVINVAGYPQVVRAHERADETITTMRLRVQASALIALLLPALAGVVLLSDAIGQTFPNPQYRGVELLMPWLALAAVLNCLRSTYSDLAFHLGKATVWVVASLGAAALLDLLLNLALLRAFGVVVAAIALCAGYALALAVSAIAGRRYIRLPLPTANHMLRVTAGTMLMSIAVKAVPTADTLLGVAMTAALGMGVYGGAYGLLRAPIGKLTYVRRKPAQ